MHTIQELQNIIDKAVKETEYPKEPKELYEPIAYLMALGGKRLRPALVLMATDLFGGNIQEALAPALAVELFHNFTLMHDDIMDKAPLRRGQPTVHAKWNESVAILSGDVMFVKAYKMMIQVKPEILTDVLEVFNATAIGVCEGQQIDMNFENRNEVTIEEYIEMIRLKTAVLVGGALKIGALIGSADKKNADLLYQFGENLGIAFQLQDDYLDAFGDPETFGKQVGGDIIENKKTYLYLKAVEFAAPQEREKLLYLFSNHPDDSTNKIQEVKEIFNTTGASKATQQAIQDYTLKAFETLQKINIDNEKKDKLQSFGENLMGRKV